MEGRIVVATRDGLLSSLREADREMWKDIGDSLVASVRSGQLPREAALITCDHWCEELRALREKLLALRDDGVRL